MTTIVLVTEHWWCRDWKFTGYTVSTVSQSYLCDHSQSTQSVSEMSLKHLHSRNTARYAEQTVSRTPMGSLLLSQGQVVIPLFQRPYCWTTSQLDSWSVTLFCLVFTGSVFRLNNISEGIGLMTQQEPDGNIVEELRNGKY